MNAKDMLQPLLKDTQTTTTIAIAPGDGIGHELMEATLNILDAANAPLAYVPLTLGKEVYEKGVKSGIPSDSWDILRQHKILLKGPITTPQGGGYKSLNVTLRKTLGLFANVRPVKAYNPFIASHFPNMDVVVIRENEEDLYAGIEHQQTAEVVQCLKLVSKPGCERIIRYAFEYARAYGRKKVTCMTKDNIMKHTDGLFHNIFDEVKQEYPDIEADHLIIDIGSALLASNPERFDVIVTLNLYGDIISDITAQIAGSVGLGGSSNVGHDFAMFEAIHGSAPDIAGKGIANPSGLINAACMMLVHLGHTKMAEQIQNALLRTIEDGIHTADIHNDAFTKHKVSTEVFSQAVIDRLGQKPTKLGAINLSPSTKPITIQPIQPEKAEKKLIGVDVFIDWNGSERNPNVLGKWLDKIAGDTLKLKMITNRGVKVYPNGIPETFCTDHWRCRFVSAASKINPNQDGMSNTHEIEYNEILDLLEILTKERLNFIKIENLYEINGKRAYSLGQGE